MNAKQTFFVLNALLVLLVVAIIGGAYGIQGLLSSHSKELVNYKAKALALDVEQTQLVQAKKDIQKYSELYKIAKTVVPESKNQAEAVRQIVKLAEANKIGLQSISFPTSSLGNSTASPTAPASAAGPSATGGASASLSQLTPVKNIPGVYDLKLIVTSSQDGAVTYSQLIKFLDSLEKNRLTALVSSISIQPDADNRNNFSFNLTLDIYIKP